MFIGCSTISLSPLTGPEALREISALQFEHVDIAAVPKVFDHIKLTEPAQEQIIALSHIVDKLGLSVNGIPTVAWAPDQIDDYYEVKRRSIVAADIASALRAKSWIVDAGRDSAEGRSRGLKRFRDTIAMQYEIAAERELRLLLEAPHVGTLADTFNEVAEVIDIASDAGVEFGLDLDTSHVHNSGVSISTMIARYGNIIEHVAIRDTKGRNTSPVPVGHGYVDFSSLVDGLRSVDFSGPLILEFEFSDTDLTDRIEFIKLGRDYIQNVIDDTKTNKG